MYIIHASDDDDDDDDDNDDDDDEEDNDDKYDKQWIWICYHNHIHRDRSSAYDGDGQL